MAQELRHGLLDEFVGNGLLRLVFIGCLRGEGGYDEDLTILHILKAYFAIALEIFPVLLEVSVDLRDKGTARGLFRRAAVLQEAGVVVILLSLLLV